MNRLLIFAIFDNQHLAAPRWVLPLVGHLPGLPM
jgi:hypothetical protein